MPRAEPTEQGDAAARAATGGAGPSGCNVERHDEQPRKRPKQHDAQQSTGPPTTRDVDTDNGTTPCNDVAGREGNVDRDAQLQQKKSFLRILRKVMNIPSESPLLATWRESRTVPETGRVYPPGWYGIQAMEEKEVDAVIVRMMPELQPQLVAVQHWSVTLAQVMRTSVEEVKQYIILKNNRYRLNEAMLSPSTLQHIRQEQERLAAMTEQAVHEQGLRQPSPSPTEERPSLLVAHGSFGDLLPAMNDLTGDIRLLPPPSSALDSPQQQHGLKQPGEASGSGFPTWGAPAMGARSGGMPGMSREALLEKLGDTLLSIYQSSPQLDLLGLQATAMSAQGLLQQFNPAVRPPNHPGDANAAPAPPQPPGR